MRSVVAYIDPKIYIPSAQKDKHSGLPMYNPVTMNLDAETSSGWITTDRLISDEITNARVSGIEIGMKEHEKIIQQQHIALRNEAVRISEEIYSELKSKFQIRPYGMKIRTQGFSFFGTLYMLNSDDFYSEKIEGIYVFLREKQKMVAAISWSFVLMPVTKQLDDSAMSSDGYSLSYVEPT
ncbi:MAG: hypothetical protein WBZ48_04085 [Bacteroidota bacterium]